MGFSLDQIKRDFVKHRKKTAILGVLASVMVLMFIKAGLEMRPRSAEGEPIAGAVNVAGEAPAEGTGEAVLNADERLKQSRELWRLMREKRGLEASLAFTFEPSYFPMDPSRRYVAEPDRVTTPEAPHAAVNSEEIERAARTREIREQARGLIVRSTVVGNGASKPVAVINEHILTIGESISGFTITAIQAREVDFKKDGVTLAVKMADDGSVQ
jgi:hypothetical protein